MNTTKPISVPRVYEMTSSRSADDERIRREAINRRAVSREITARYGFGTKAAREAWISRVGRSRSF